MGRQGAMERYKVIRSEGRVMKIFVYHVEFENNEMEIGNCDLCPLSEYDSDSLCMCCAVGYNSETCPLIEVTI